MFNSYNPYYNYNPYFNPQQQVPVMKTNNLQGKSIDNLEVVKAMDIPLDGSVSYFPLTDGSAIVTKQLQQDGTSKIIIYKPIENAEEPSTKYVTFEEFDNKMNSVKYVTPEELDNKINNIKMPDTKSLQDDIKSLKKQIRILLDKEE